MKRVLLSLLTLFLTLLAGVAAAPCASACSCVPPPEGTIPDADLIAEVTLVDVDRGWSTNTFTFRVHREWKGPGKTQIEVDSNAAATACGADFEGGGARYLLFAGEHDGRLATSGCSSTSRLDVEDPTISVADVQAQLGDGSVPPDAGDVLIDQPDSSPDPARLWLAAGLGGGAALALAALAGSVIVLVRRR